MSVDPLIIAIKKRREAMGMSTKEAGAAIGMSGRTYKRIEDGESSIRMNSFRTLIKVLKTTELDLYLDMIGIKDASAWDVMAAARVLPPQVRTTLVSLIMMLDRHYNEED